MTPLIKSVSLMILVLAQRTVIGRPSSPSQFHIQATPQSLSLRGPL